MRLLRCFALVGVVSAGFAAAQSTFGPEASEIHMTNSMSSNGAIVALSNPVTGQPYEATKVMRSSWKLGDGTTIRHESESKIARDGDGRFREDIENTQSGSFGGKQTDVTLEQSTVADPMDHSLTMWSGKVKTAIRMQMPDMSGLTKTPAGMPGIVGAPPAPPPAGTAGLRFPNGKPVVLLPPPRAEDTIAPSRDKDEVRTEDLGKQSVAGVLATGKRTMTVIALGKIGNDQPITVVHEEWYSPDLKVVVKSVDSDPRSGERTMELTGLTRGDPDPALFHAPAGYEVTDMAGMMKSMGSPGSSGGGK